MTRAKSGPEGKLPGVMPVIALISAGSGSAGRVGGSILLDAKDGTVSVVDDGERAESMIS